MKIKYKISPVVKDFDFYFRKCYKEYKNFEYHIRKYNNGDVDFSIRGFNRYFFIHGTIYANKKLVICSHSCSTKWLILWFKKHAKKHIKNLCRLFNLGCDFRCLKYGDLNAN